MIELNQIIGYQWGSNKPPQYLETSKLNAQSRLKFGNINVNQNMFKMNTHHTSISVVIMFINNPIIVIRLGANQIGTFSTSQFHQGCSKASHILELLQEY